MAWSPIVPDVFACVGQERVEIWDLKAGSMWVLCFLLNCKSSWFSLSCWLKWVGSMVETSPRLKHAAQQPVIQSVVLFSCQLLSIICNHSINKGYFMVGGACILFCLAVCPLNCSGETCMFQWCDSSLSTCIAQICHWHFNFGHPHTKRMSACLTQGSKWWLIDWCDFCSVIGCLSL